MNRRESLHSLGLGLGAALLPPQIDFGAAPIDDVLVYGGTPSGVMAAVAAARMGAHVALLEPGTQLGGMVSSGLGCTDFGHKAVIGGLPLEFFERVGGHYGDPIAWYFEPHVAEEAFQGMARDAGVKVFYQHRLDERDGVSRDGPHITAVTAENGARFPAQVFIDASYEGDLMAQSKVSFTWGREGWEEFNETLAGVVGPADTSAGHRFLFPVSAYDEHGKLLPEISAEPRGEVGAGDRKIQAYNFRMCLTMDRDNQAPFPEPAHYDPHRYTLLKRLIDAIGDARGSAARFHEARRGARNNLVKLDVMPNGKTDINNNGPFSTDYIGGSWEYPTAGYHRRQEIWQAHFDYVAGFFYFLAHDSQVPAELRAEVGAWGLAKDEFVDSHNWPPQLYVREVRRMRGGFVMTQRDAESEIEKDDSIGMGSYNMDSHNVQRFVTSSGTVQNEGDVESHVLPYQIAYRVLLPKPAECQNLLSPVCCSATHIAYGTLREEPAFMVMGHAAGVAAKLAVDSHQAVQKVDLRSLQDALRKQGAVLSMPAGYVEAVHR